MPYRTLPVILQRSAALRHQPCAVPKPRA